MLKLKTDSTADFNAKSSYSVTVTATDSDGLSVSKTLTVVVNWMNQSNQSKLIKIV